MHNGINTIEPTTNRKIYVWYREKRHLCEYIQFEATDLINMGGKRVTKKSKPYLYVGAGQDTETSKISIDSNISIVYAWQFSIGKINFVCRDIELLPRFLKELSDLIKDVHSNATLLVLDANISYEYSYTWRLLRDNITDVFAKSKSKICSYTVHGNIKIQECLGVFGTSLENIAKNYTNTKKRKGDLNYNVIRNKHTYLSRKNVLYCVNDVAILSELSIIAHNMFTLKGDKIPFTQTGIVRNEVKKNMCKHFLDRTRYINAVNELIGTENEYKTFRTFLYSGGLTHSNFKYVGYNLNKDLNMHIKCKDLTSAYPWAMNAFSFPSGKLIKGDNLQFTVQHKHWILKVRLIGIKSKSTHSTISQHKCVKLLNATIDNGRIYEADMIELYVSEVDMHNINLIYNTEKIQCIEHWYFTKSSRAPKEMLDVMNDWYIKKTRLKPLTKDSHSNDADYISNCKEYMRLKQLINSCYGMLVTSLYFESYKYDTDGIKCEQVKYDDAKTTIFNPYIGYWVTAYVRSRLIEVIAKFPDDIVQYDTDSLYYNANNTDLEQYFNSINNEVYNNIITKVAHSECHDLGQWDDDGDYINGFICLGSKRYAGEHYDGTVKITFAGANKKDILKYAKQNNMHVFDYLKNFSICAYDSEKKGAVHEPCDFETITHSVIDYKGNYDEITCYGYTTIVNVPFNAQLSTAFSELRNKYNISTCR